MHMHTKENTYCQGQAAISKQQPEDSTKVTSEIYCFSINFISVTSKEILAFQPASTVSILMLPVRALDCIDIPIHIH